MQRAFAILVCIAATYALYGTTMGLVLVWYSGSEDQITLREWIELGVHTFVHLAALAMAWQLAHRRSSTAAKSTTG